MADTAPSTPGFFDGLGDRVVVTDRSARALEVLRLRPELVSDPRFEASLRARVELLAAFQHPGSSRVRHVGRLPAPDGRLAIVSDDVTGWRLSEVLQAAERLNLALHTNAVFFLLRQLVTVAAELHALGPDVSHGALGPERLVVTATGRLVMMEPVLGGALPFAPGLSPQRAWRDLRVALPADDPSPFGQRTDVLQAGLCALALVLGRPLRLDDYPARLRELLDHATESLLTGERRPVRPPLRAWLEHVLGLSSGAGPTTMDDARQGLDRLVSRDGYLATPTGLVSLLGTVEQYFSGAIEEPVDPPRRGLAASPALAEPEMSQAPGQTPLPVEEGVTAPDVAIHPVAEETPAVLPVVPRAEPPIAEPLIEPAVVRTFEEKKAPGAVEIPGLDLAPGPRPVQPLDPEPSVVTDAFAPEPGISFPPDAPSTGGSPDAAALAPAADHPAPPPFVPIQPVPQAQRPPAVQDAPASQGPLPSGPRPSVAAVPLQKPPAPPVASGPRPIAPSGPRPIGTPRGSGAHPVPPEPPVVEPLAGTLGASHPAPPRREPAFRDHAASGPTPAARSLFGVQGDQQPSDEDVEEALVSDRPSRRPWVVGGIGAIVLAAAVAAWLLMGPRGDATSAAGEAAQRAEAIAPQSQPAAQPSATAANPPAPARGSAPASSPAGQAGVPAGQQAAAPVEASQPAGEVRVIVPFVADVLEGGQKIGTSEAGIALPPGRHTLDFVNAELGFRATQTVQVRAGSLARLQPAVPRGSANINAIPWAEVWIDGARAGETPLGNILLPIGPHQVQFKHPQLGEQTKTLVVTATAPARLSVEMKQ